MDRAAAASHLAVSPVVAVVEVASSVVAAAAAVQPALQVVQVMTKELVAVEPVVHLMWVE